MLRIDIVGDLVCPWCFIGKRRLERAVAMRPGLRTRRVWRPFQLNPDLPLEGLPYETYLRIKFGGGRSALRLHAVLAVAGAREGIDFAFGRIGRTPNTLQAHRLMFLAAAAGTADTVAEALYCGYFSHGLDIGDLDTLAAIARLAGMDAAEIRTALEGSAGLAEVIAGEYGVRRAGIDAVPCFIIGDGHAVAGAQEPEMFLPLFDLAAVSPRSTML